MKDYSLITGDVNFAHLKKILMKEERLCRTDQRNHADIPDVQNSLTEDTARNIYLSIRKLHARQPSEATAASGGRKAKLILENILCVRVVRGTESMFMLVLVRILIDREVIQFYCGI